MDYQGQNVNPNFTPDVGQSVAASNILETPNLSHDVQGMGAVGSSAAKDAIEQMMQESLAGQDVINDDSNVIDLLNERPPLSPEVTSGEIEEALKDTGVVSEVQGLANEEVKDGDTLSSKIVEDVKNAIKKIDDDLPGFYDEFSKKNNDVVTGFRGYGIGEK